MSKENDKPKKLDLKSIAERIRKSFKDDKRGAQVFGTGADIITPSKPEDFVVLDPWWKEATGVLGLPFGYVFMIAGNSDSAKTSFAIEAIKKAQDQGVHVILVDTEKKTVGTRLTARGIDPEQIALIRPDYLEDAYDGIDKYLEYIKDADPDGKVLVIFDSLGNTPARAEAATDVDDSLQMGLAAKINKRGFRRLVPRLNKDKIHILVINQTYANMGSSGRTNSGGNAVDFFSALTFQTSRMKWLEKTVKGEVVRIGARAVWTLYKQHLIGDAPLQKKVLLDVTKDGIKLVGSEDNEE